MRIFTISLIARMLLLSLFPTVAIAAEIQNNTSQNKNKTGLIKISEGNVEKIESHNIGLSEAIVTDSVKSWKKQNEKKLSASEKRILAYNKKLQAYTPPKGKIEILATGYSSTVDQCDGDPFTTASGTRVHKGTIACPPQYPFGTKVEIEGVGKFVCEDRGGAIKGNHFDIWFETRAQALAWGKRIVTAEIKK